MKQDPVQQNIDNIVRNIKAIRLSKGYSQDYMAAKLNISQNSYSKIELGYVSLTVRRLFEVTSLLEVDFLDLLTPDLDLNAVGIQKRALMKFVS